jgi:RNA polymerase sigma-70 factor, ECF subfamily
MTTETETTVDADRDDSVLPDLDVTFGRAWREHRRYVLDIAFRTLGDIGEAEDVVQEAFARLLGVDIDEIHDVRAWLVVVVGRLCIDRLRLAHRQRETSTETPPDTSRHQTAHTIDPADRVTLDDRVCIALHDVLERLTPAERTTFVLHDVFAFTFDDIGAIVGRSPEACRQLASRARRHIRTDATAPRFPVETADQRRICDVFIAACATGELDGLLAVLDPDVAGQVDLGGTIGLRPPVVGSLALRQGHLVATITLSLRHGMVHHIHAVCDPVKLAPIAERLGARPPEPRPARTRSHALRCRNGAHPDRRTGKGRYREKESTHSWTRQA